MNILIINHSYTSKEAPIDYIFVHNQAKQLQSLGHKVIVMDIDLRSPRWKRKYGRYNEIYDGIMVYRFAVPLGSSKLKKIARKITEIVAPKIYKEIQGKYGNIDVLYAHFAVHGGYAGLILKQKFHIPLVLLEHSSYVLKTEIEKLSLERMVYAEADRVLAVSNALKKKIERMVDRKVEIIPNMIDTDLFKNNSVAKFNEYTFISIGNLIERKNFEKLIQVFSEFNILHKNSRLLICGEGDLKPKLEKLIKNLDLTSHVDLLGQVCNKDLPSLLNQSHCFILLSKFETFGIVYAEAIACGIPAISINCGGSDDIINQNVGIICENDSEIILNAMEYMYYHSDKFDPQKLHLYIEENFSAKNIAKKISQVLRESCMEKKCD